VGAHRQCIPARLQLSQPGDPSVRSIYQVSFARTFHSQEKGKRKKKKEKKTETEKQEKKSKGKERKEKTTPFSVNLTRSQSLY